MERLLKGAIEALGEPVALVDPSGRVVFVTTSLQRLMGIPGDSSEGRMCQDLFGDDLCRAALCPVLSGGTSCPAFQVGYHSGSVECRGIFDPFGKFEGVLLSFSRRDAELRMALGDLAFQRRLLSAVTDDDSTVFAVLDRSGRVVHCNGFARDLLPRQGSPFIWEMVSKDHVQAVKDALRSGGVLHVKAFKGEQLRHLLLKLVLLSGGREKESVLLIGHDITDLVLARQNLDVFRSALDQFAEWVCITDPSGTITYVNSAFEEMYGYTLKEALGKNPRILNPGPEVYEEHGISREEYEEIFRRLWRDVLDPAVGRWEGEVLNRRKDGSVIWVRLIVSAIRDVNGDISALLAIPVDLSALKDKEEQVLLEAYRAIMLTAEMRDEETGEHLIRIGSYCRLLAEAMGMPDKFCKDMELFAPFHDIGKVGIPDSILLAPRRLDPGEFELMKTHTVMGYNILKDKRSLSVAAEIALYHHERWDGSGYPYGLKETEIPLSARITAVADVYDALRSRRPYKEPMDHQRVVDYITANSGVHFDPSVVQAFMDVHLEMDQVFVLNGGSVGDAT
ncbi:PAS domain S-box [Thermanaerovibrio velox DSM 12556]|uniref:PAS domain S-box n=1 Tax=Thermanaerovibrio velox DSM 12556 TaxID=926567 RepID=H0UN03_9BACT|nr:HD domain-containing phosphohydrolase [Thermanaerovibrio velox]EHM09282.1 PAS domain S-box [Thermanaerovibrio velox DSM 12556]